MSEEHAGLGAALLAFQAEVPTLPKDAENRYFDSKFTPLDTMVEVVGPLLVKHGLVWTALPGRDDDGAPALHYRLLHAASGEVLEGTMALLLARDDPQGQGSALTYARRYAMAAVLNLVADEDDDGNGASERSNGGSKGQFPLQKGFASDKQYGFMQNLLREAGVPAEAQAEILSYCSETMSGERGGPISNAIDWLKVKDENRREKAAEKLLADARAHHAQHSDVPYDETGLPPTTEPADVP